MTQEEKQLLLVDLCGRLLYKTNLHIYYEDIAGSSVFDEELYEIDIDGQYCNDGRRLEDIKPYLRPMSSMTEEENKTYQILTPIVEVVFECDAYPLIDFLNAHHFDYRGLIKKGLALEALEGMYDN